MDLGAFLQAGRSYPVLFEDASATGVRPTRGAVVAHRGRPFWWASGALAVGSCISLSLEMKGFALGADFALCPGAPDDAAPLMLAGRLSACRYFRLLGGYALRVTLMGRILPE